MKVDAQRRVLRIDGFRFGILLALGKLTAVDLAREHPTQYGLHQVDLGIVRGHGGDSARQSIHRGFEMVDNEQLVRELHRQYELLEEESQGEGPDLATFVEQFQDRYPTEVIQQFHSERKLLDGFQENFPTKLREDVNANYESMSRFCGGRYEIQRVFEKGGLGVVYLALDRELDRMVAVKGIRPEFSQKEDARKRFERESKVTGVLEHPGIVPVYGFGNDEQGNPFYTMKFIHGEKLTDAIDRFHQSKADQDDWLKDFQKLLRHFVTVCQTIAFAHSRGFVHRDIKPDNIRIGSFGEVLVVDWGLARSYQSSSDQVELPEDATDGSDGETHYQTRAGVNLGTLMYMSPEQADSSRGPIGPASDVYSLGATLFQILTGTHYLKSGSRAEILLQIASQIRPDPSERNRKVPKPLAAICRKAISLRVEERYETAGQLAEDIERWFADQPVTAYAEPFALKVRRWLKTHKTLATGIAAAVLVGMLTVAVAAILLAFQGEQLKEAVAGLTRRNDELRRLDYTSQFMLARQAFVDGNAVRAEQFLNGADTDLRGLEWTQLRSALGGDSLRTLYEIRDITQKIPVLGETSIELNGNPIRLPSYAVEVPTGMKSEGADQIALTNDSHIVVLLKGKNQGAFSSIPKPSWMVNVHSSKTGTLVRTIAGEGWAREFRLSADGRTIAILINRMPSQASFGDKELPADSPREQVTTEGISRNLEALDLDLGKFSLPDLSESVPAGQGVRSPSKNDSSSTESTASKDEGRTADSRTEVRVYDLTTGALQDSISNEQLQTIYGKAQDRRTAIHPDQRIEARYDAQDGLIHFSDRKAKRPVAILLARSKNALRSQNSASESNASKFGDVPFLEFTSDGERIVWLTSEGTVYSAEVPKGPEVSECPPSLRDAVRIRVAADGEHLISLHSSQSTAVVRLWRGADGTHVKEFSLDRKLIVPTADGGIHSMDAELSPNGELLVVADGQSVTAFEVTSGRVRFRLPGTVGPICFTRDGKQMTAMRLPMGLIDRIESDQLIDRVTPASLRQSVQQILQSKTVQGNEADKQLMDQIGYDQFERLRMVTLGDRVAAGPAFFDTRNGDILDVFHSTSSPVSAAIDPTGSRLARHEGSSRDLVLFDTATSKSEILKFSDSVGLFQFAPSGESIAVQVGGKVQIIDTFRWKTVSELEIEGRSIDNFYFHANGELILTSTANAIQLWTARTGSMLWEFVSPADVTFDYAVLSRDRQQLVVGDKTTVLKW